MFHRKGLLKLEPTYKLEKTLLDDGYTFIAGVDEAGRGALAGPVVAAAVVLPRDVGVYILQGVKESKQVTSRKRLKFFDLICSKAVAIGVGIVSSEVIDEINIYNATLLAMKKAVQSMNIKPDYLLIDGNQVVNIDIAQKAIVKGDCKCLSISCASILAKVTRDRIMNWIHEMYPQYKFPLHKGYATREHIKTLELYGPSPVHRYSFAPVKNLLKII